MALKVHFLQEYEKDFFDELGKLLLPDIEFTCSEKTPEAPIYDILVSGVPSQESIDASPNLRHLIIPWAGLPAKTRDLMLNYPDITIHNIHHNAAPVAEMAITMMMALAKDLINIDRALRNNDWTHRYEAPTIKLIEDTTALIVGFGTVGKEIAKRCQALGMKVKAIRRSAEEAAESGVEVFPVSRMNDLLKEAGVVFLSLPLTAQTKQIIGKSELSLLPQGAIVINISRGRIIDEQALYEALKNGKIKAGLDVWYNYPDLQAGKSDVPPSEYPFGELDNVVMTPHLAGHSDMTEVLRAREIALLLNAASSGGELLNRVDLRRGY